MSRSSTGIAVEARSGGDVWITIDHWAAVERFLARD